MLALHLGAQRPLHDGLDEFQILHDRIAGARNLAQPVWRSAKHFGNGAERFDQRLRQPLRVRARDGAEQQQLEEFVIRKRLRPGLREARPQPLPVSFIVLLDSWIPGPAGASAG